MFSPSTATPARPPRWPFLVLLFVTAAGLWALDGRQPAPWLDSATPWSEQLRALSPASWTLDAINARVPMTPDLPLGSVLVLLAIMGCALASLLTLDVPVPLALAVALGLGATRSLWSTIAPGRDALAVALMAFAVVLVARTKRSTTASAATAIAAMAIAPAACWLVAPIAAWLAPTRRARWLAVLGVIGLSVVAQALLLREAWTAVPCLPSGEWMSAMMDVLRPGESADASALLALRRAFSILTGDVHVFGVVVAAFGLVRASASAGALRLVSLVAMAVGTGSTAAGLMSPGLTVALLLPWWAAWFGRGLAELVRDTRDARRPLAAALAVVVALATPLLRHAAVAPSPWHNGMPAVSRAVAGSWKDGLIASDDHGLTRRLRLVGAVAVPADARTLGLCVASGRPVYALGPTIRRVEYLGHGVAERPLRAPLAAVLRDVRADQLVALALSPPAIAWADPAGISGLRRLALTRDALLGHPSVGVVARTDRAGEVRTGRTGLDLVLRTGDSVAGRALLAPISVSAHEDHVVVNSAPARLAAGRHAALAIFDRSQDVALRSVGVAATGLPMPLMRHSDWRQVEVLGQTACVSASRRWTNLPARVRRLSVPSMAASGRRPVLLYLASSSKPAIGVTGLPPHPLWPAWSAEAFDTQVPAQASRLDLLEASDAVPSSLRSRGRWVTRVAIAPHGPWDAHRVAVSAGTAAEGWLVRLAADGRRAETNAVCPMASTGDRLLDGQYGALDDESEREIAVHAADGWHAAERLHGDVFQWTANRVATASFILEAEMPLTLAMDAAGATESDGPQPVVVRINDRVLRADWHGADRVEIPAGILRVGQNTIALEVGRVVQPQRDARALGVLVRQLRVIGPERR